MITEWDNEESYNECLFSIAPEHKHIKVTGVIRLAIDVAHAEGIQQVIDWHLQMMETAIIRKLKKEI